ncbi:MAG: ClbS/DfsB family four-helix bundle protein [Anaerolineales bacterium]|nr:ClbS/DfsB family four-helix bundle protein [Anaerolineales bacterium]
MAQTMTKETLLAAFRRGREEFETLLSRFDDDQLLQPGVEADWSIKDVMWHITAWERTLCGWLADVSAGRVPADTTLTDADVDRMNAEFDAAGRELALAEVQAAFAAAYPQVLEALLAVPEADLIDPERFAWRQGRPLWHMVGGNTFWHYQEHTEPIRERLTAET